jgi:hypothetical protein
MASSAASTNRLPAHLRLDTTPLAAPDAVVQGERWRFTVLTDRLIRMEYSSAGEFEDRASQFAINRDFTTPEFRVVRDGDHVTILTEHLQLSYDGQPFSPSGLSVTLTGNLSAHDSTWRYSVASRRPLGGTARTLDDADGAVELEPGVISRDGYAVVDDSATLLLEDDGWFSPRTKAAVGDPVTQDLYFFGYGHDYRGAITDFYRLSGATPLIPRFALGNWWSRYYPYTQSEYIALMERFAAKGMPFSVAVVDMDWHNVDVDPRYGSGWTGYTWNTDLFPDPDAFATWLHNHGLRLTLNVHPADGVQGHEDAYQEMAAAMGVDASAGDPIVFDVTDPQFVRAYFSVLHHPLESRGVDFWWVDWQSGSHSRIEGLDPLWVLNHLHFLDNGRPDRGDTNTRPLTFSRYAGPGSHRYPVGFSGDTVVSWDSLRFQPYFTATATNIGYGWWSHDIGGHLGGSRDNDLAVRWTQFGVFSPIMRLHSSSGQFNGKEPWRYSPEAQQIMSEFLRLRHRLVPYLHTANHASAAGGLPLVVPMYYNHPERPEAYSVPNQYMYGTELLVSPITDPLDPRLGVARTRAWLPDGLWVDFFTGLVYRGGRTAYLHRTAKHFPVLARAGAVIPLTAPQSYPPSPPPSPSPPQSSPPSSPPSSVPSSHNSLQVDVAANPAELELQVFAGADGHFDLVEDDGGLRTATTPLVLNWSASEFEVRPALGDPDVLPPSRALTITFFAFDDPGEVEVWLGGRRVSSDVTVDSATNSVRVVVDAVSPREQLRVRFAGGMRLGDNHVDARVIDVVTHAQIEFDQMQAVRDIVTADVPAALMASQLEALDLPPLLYGTLLELIAANPG